jgi:isopenicillin-N epimerase
VAVPDAIRFGEELLPGGWPALCERNHALALAGRNVLCERLGIEAPAPDEMIGCMASMPLPIETEPGRV